MSIYCSYFGFGDEHSPKCERITKTGRKEYTQDDSKPCTCGSAPVIYQGSHVLPSRKDKRDGLFGFAAIPPHITRNGRDDKPEDGKWYPWLRFHLSGGNKDTVILDRKQVQKLHAALGGWLESS